MRVVDTLNEPTTRRAQLFNAYSSCLLDHGANRATDGVVADWTFTGTGILIAQPIPAAAESACINVVPASPPALDANTNPEFADQADDYVSCLGELGLMVRLLNDHNLDWTYLADRPIPNDPGGAQQDACLVAAFGRG